MVKLMKHVLKTNLQFSLDMVLLYFSIIFFGFYDLLSTLVAYNYLGSFEYETGALPNILYMLGGVNGFIIGKAVIVGMCGLVIYAIMDAYGEIRSVGRGLMIGMILSGILVGSSNLNIMVNGQSFEIGGVAINNIVISILAGSIASGIVYMFIHDVPGKKLKS